MRILIDAGVPLDHVNRLGWTALHEAIVLGDGGADHLAAVRLLLGAGADPELPDGDGTSPRDLAASRGYSKIVAAIDAATDE
jgi:ankyrin repeat protein